MKRTQFDILSEEERRGKVRLGEREWELRWGTRERVREGKEGKEGKQGKRRRGQGKMRTRGQEEVKRRGKAYPRRLEVDDADEGLPLGSVLANKLSRYPTAPWGIGADGR